MDNFELCRGEAVGAPTDATFSEEGRLELHAQNRELAAKLSELQQALHMNEMVVAMVGHDLRNPLGAILNGTDLVSRLSSDDRLLKVAGLMRSSGNRMGRMIEQLLEVARIRAGRIEMKPVEADLYALSRSIIDELPKTPGGQDRVELSSEGPTQGRFDPDRIGAAISNLVGNALQHGARESKIRVHVDGTAGEHMVLQVRNAGVIPPETLATMFQPFHSSAPGSGARRGLGLGLYIVNEFVAAHGGTVRASSSMAEGTVVEMRLPRGPVDRSQAPPRHGGENAKAVTPRGNPMKTSDLCRRAAVTATADTPLSEIAALMRTHHVGSIVVVRSTNEPRPVGIVTDRDIVLEVVAAGLDPRTVTAGEIMTAAPVVAQADDDVWWALKVMRERGVRRLPIVDASQRVIGVIALDDVVQHVGTALNDIAQLIGSERVAESAHRA